MHIKFVLLSVACLSYVVVPTSAVGLLAAAASAAGTIKGAILRAGVAGIGSLSQPPQETVIINAEPSKPFIEIDVAQPSPVPVQVVPYYPNRPVQIGAVVPRPPIYGGLWSSIQSAILTKAQAIAGLISSLKPQQPQQIIVVNTPTPTKKPHTNYEIILEAEPRIQPVAMPVPVFINKK